MTRYTNPLLTVSTRRNLLDIQVDDVTVTALIDTGAQISIMSAALRTQLRKVITPAIQSTVRVADGSSSAVLGMCTARVCIAGHQTIGLFAVLAQCPHDVILGLDFLSTHSALIDCSTGVLQLELPFDAHVLSDTPSRLCSVEFLHLPPQASTYVPLSPSPPVCDGEYVVSPILDVVLMHSVVLPHTVVTVRDNKTCLPLLNFGLSTHVLPAGIALATMSSLQECAISVLAVDGPRTVSGSLTATSSLCANFEKMISADLSHTQAEDLRRVLLSYSDIFDLENRPLGQTTVVQHSIHTGDAQPVHRRPYRVSAAERAIIQKEVDKMLAKNIIEPSSSPWAAPVVLVKKKDNTWRFCVDYRHLNKITKKDVYPLPRIDDALDCLHGAQYFSSIDLRSGYWQIAVDPLDREKTAFVTPDGLYHFKVMPFGLCNAPATFERMMDSLLRGLKWSTCLCYLDDVIVFSPTFDSHLQRLSTILEVFRNAGLQLNASKCRFGRREITVLGHLVNATGVQPDPENVRAVKEFSCTLFGQRRTQFYRIVLLFPTFYS